MDPLQVHPLPISPPPPTTLAPDPPFNPESLLLPNPETTYDFKRSGPAHAPGIPFPSNTQPHIADAEPSTSKGRKRKKSPAEPTDVPVPASKRTRRSRVTAEEVPSSSRLSPTAAPGSPPPTQAPQKTRAPRRRAAKSQPSREESTEVLTAPAHPSISHALPLPALAPSPSPSSKRPSKKACQGSACW